MRADAADRRREAIATSATFSWTVDSQAPAVSLTVQPTGGDGCWPTFSGHAGGVQVSGNASLKSTPATGTPYVADPLAGQPAPGTSGLPSQGCASRA